MIYLSIGRRRRREAERRGGRGNGKERENRRSPPFPPTNGLWKWRAGNFFCLVVGDVVRGRRLFSV